MSSGPITDWIPGLTNTYWGWWVSRQAVIGCQGGLLSGDGAELFVLVLGSLVFSEAMVCKLAIVSRIWRV